MEEKNDKTKRENSKKNLVVFLFQANNLLGFLIATNDFTAFTFIASG